MYRSHPSARSGLLAVALSFVATGAHAADPVFTEAWEGIWDADFIERECDGGAVIAEFDGLARMCGGDPARFNQGLAFDYTCDGTVTDDTMDMTCIFETEPFPGCTAMYDYVLSAVRVGDAMTGTEVFELTFVGDCVGLEPYCSDTEFDGARTTTDPECGTPTRPASWTQIKSVYR